MAKVSSSRERVNILRWIARIFGTFIVLFMSSQFIGAIIRKGSLNVPHSEHYILLALLSVSSIAILIAWKWEGLGGILGISGIVLADLLNLFWIQTPKLVGFLIGSLFWLLPSIVFIYCWLKTKNELNDNPINIDQ